MPIEGRVKPTEDFWINLSAESIYTASERLVKGGETLKAIITWAYGIFIAGGFAVAVFGPDFKNYSPYALYCFGGAYFLLTIAQVVVTRAQVPVSLTYNPNDPVQIQQVFSEKAKTQADIFSWAMGITFTAFFLLATGILIQFYSLTKKEEVKKAPSLYVKAGLEKRGDSIYIPVTVMSKKNEPVNISFINSGNIDSTANNKKVFFSRVFYTDTSGRLYYSYHLAYDSIKKLVVKATVKEFASADSVTEASQYVRIMVSK